MALTGKIARIDLASGRIQTRPVTPELRAAFLGGNGIGGYLQYVLSQAQAESAEESASLWIDAGLLSGTPAPDADRVVVTARSAAARFVESHLLKGFFGPELRFAGFDHVIVEGRAPSPVFLWLNDGRIQIREAADMWLDTPNQVRRRIRDRMMAEDACVMAMGTDGPIHDHEAAAGGGCASPGDGLAAAMGALNLKAVAVRGTRAIAIADPQSAIETLRHIMGQRQVRADEVGAEEIEWLEDRMPAAVASESAGRVLDALGIAQKGLRLQADDEQQEQIYTLFRAVTGLTYSQKDLLKAGERATNVERLLNLKAGYRRRDEPYHNALLGCRGAMDRVSDERLFDRVLDRYYAVHGWDRQGRPSRATLKRLGLDRELAI